MSNSTTSGIVV